MESQVMGLLDGILGQLGGASVGALAEKFGVSPELAEQAVAALGQSHAEPGDTIAGAAAKTGLDAGTLSQMAEQLGGAGGLEQISNMMKDNPALAGVAGMLDRDGDGNPINDVLGMAGKLFGKN
jgi:ATP phosphoribosyltransferase regulatory subunit HisZ